MRSAALPVARAATIAVQLTAALAVGLALATGCSDAAPTLIDGGPLPDADLCLIPHGYGALGSQPGVQDSTNTGTPSITIDLETTPPKDVMFLSLTTGRGAFAAGLKTGTFPITGADADFNTCGPCTTILANIDAQTGPAKFFFTDSGTITLTSTHPVAGSAQNLHFVEIDLGTAGKATPVQGGCTTTIDSIAFQ